MEGATRAIPSTTIPHSHGLHRPNSRLGFLFPPLCHYSRSITNSTLFYFSNFKTSLRTLQTSFNFYIFILQNRIIGPIYCGVQYKYWAQLVLQQKQTHPHRRKTSASPPGLFYWLSGFFLGVLNNEGAILSQTMFMEISPNYKYQN